MAFSLKSIRTFVVAVRCGSFTRAASQLNVSQGAVSQQLARLEADLDTSLFERSGRRHDLTNSGRRLFLAVADSVDRIDRAIESIQARDRTQQLALTCLGSFAAQWLVPRLEIFQTEHPEVRIRLDTSPGLWDPETLHLDMGIRTGLGRWSGLKSELLFDDRLIAVASGGTAASLAGPECLPRLADTDLNYDLDAPGEWFEWFRATGIESPPRLGYGFSDTLVMLAAIGRGQGVALVRESLIDQELRSGALVQLHETTIPAWGATYLVYPEDHPLGDVFTSFRGWLRGQVSRYLLEIDSGR